MGRVAPWIALACALGLAAPAAAQSTKYRWPIDNQGVNYHYDHNGGSGSPEDYMCGSRSYSGHRGIDLTARRGTNVYAAATGEVIRTMDGFGDGFLGSNDGDGFGNHVVLFHGNPGDETIYGHFTAGTVVPEVGSTQTCGTLLGKSGTSGNSSGPHLHFETRRNVNPNRYYSGSADDPYAGPCSEPDSNWVDQNGGSPLTTCADTDPPDPVDNAAYVADVSVPDGTEYTSGDAFTKTWRIQNTGTTDWGAGYQLVHVSGPSFAGDAMDVAALAGAEVEVSVPMVASGDGLQRSVWQMSKEGAPFGQQIWVEINVSPAPGEDGDGDGFSSAVDCNDDDPKIYPGATEVCDEVDNDCSGAADEDLQRTCCGTGMQACLGSSWGPCDVSCDEEDPGANPGTGPGSDNTVTPNNSDDDDNPDSPGRPVTGGCAVGTGSGGTGSLISLLLFGLGAVILRRRSGRAAARSSIGS